MGVRLLQACGALLALKSRRAMGTYDHIGSEYFYLESVGLSRAAARAKILLRCICHLPHSLTGNRRGITYFYATRKQLNSAPASLHTTTVSLESRG